ncbi:MAG: hypothetical protein WAO55_14970 [Candidatus Manganitrophaceae bacterium]
MRNRFTPVIFLICGLAACRPEVPQPSQNEGTVPVVISGAAEKLTPSDYNALSSEQKYAVADRLMATLYKGVPVSEFFDVTAGLGSPTLKGGEDFLVKTETALFHPLEEKEVYTARIDEKYRFDSFRKPVEYPAAMLFEFPVSRDFFHRWIAYKLANTILFSPALENDSVDYTDIQDIYSRLVRMMEEGKPVREIVYEHMISQENWRRFRSPEDNTREMIEIFLGLFDRDADVPKAAIACKNWSLTDDQQGYQLVIGFDENTKPQEVLGVTVVSCYDFYKAISQHPLLISRIASVLVDHFFVGYSAEKRGELINSIVSANPTRFEQLFSIILFSKEYLLNVERTKGLEEAFFSIAARIKWVPYDRFFLDLSYPFAGATFSTLRNMGQATFVYKLGRFPEVPLDSLGFSYYHKLIRERLLTDRKTDAFASNDGGWQRELINVSLQGDEFIHYLFLSVISRKATAEELKTLNDVIVRRRFQNNKEGQAMIVFDYLSRLSEVYQFSGIR